MEHETVRVTRRGAAATIVLDRPELLNAWNRRLGEELLAALQCAAGDDSVRAVCITGAGRAFSSGADLQDLSAEPGPDGRPDVYKVLTERYHPIITAVRRMPKPVVAAVNGPAVGIGCSLAMACDLLVARRSAYFLLAFVNIGLACDGGSSLLLPTRVGLARAAEMAMLGDRVGAPQALEWGLVNRVLDDDAFDAGVDTLVDRLAAGPTRSYAAIKRQLNHGRLERMDEQLELEARVQQEMVASADFAEGVAAFVHKRPAAFEGA